MSFLNDDIKIHFVFVSYPLFNLTANSVSSTPKLYLECDYSINTTSLEREIIISYLVSAHIF